MEGVIEIKQDVAAQKDDISCFPLVQQKLYSVSSILELELMCKHMAIDNVTLNFMLY